MEKKCFLNEDLNPHDLARELVYTQGLVDIYRTKVLKLEKALDNACLQLCTHYEPFDAEELEKYHWTKEQWKEWCMKDEIR